MRERELDVQCGPPDKIGKRLVIFTCGGDSHREHINTDNASERRCRSRERAMTRLALAEDEWHEQLEFLIEQAADLQDARAESEPFFKPVITMLDTVTPRKVEWVV